MTQYNKLKIAIFTIISSQTISAITLSPIQIQSDSGDLLYAEMKFSHSNPNEKLEVGLAESDDLISMGASHQPPGHLNFFTRRSGDGSGVIVITSSRPVIESELNILLKIKEGNAYRIQKIKTPLTRNRRNNEIKASSHEKPLNPQIIVSEKDIALNLPTSTQYQITNPSSAAKVDDITMKKTSSSQNNSTALVIQTSAPPALSIVKSSVNVKATQQNISHATTPSIKPSISTKPETNSQAKTSQIAVQSKIKPEVSTQSHRQKSMSLKEQSQLTAQDKPKNQPQTAPQALTHQQVNAKMQQKKITESTTLNKKIQQPKPLPTTSSPNQQHIVQANESLWKIAAQIAAQTDQAIPTVMQQIKQNNQHAFIQGDINRMRQGIALNLSTNTGSLQQKQPNQAQAVQQKQSGTAKYRLNQAEMSLTTDSEQNTASGGVKKENQHNKKNPDLSLKVMTERQKTVKLQDNVSQLSSALQQKDHRIQLLNARLAQLQQQLQLQSRAEKKKH